jgi:Ca2+-binding RTX toxin-like protein
VLDGGLGADTLRGGAGDDVYVVDGGDVVFENLGEGADTVQASADYQLSANVENLTLTGGAVSGTGNALANVIIGNAGDNLLDGRGGNDRLEGGAGNDQLLATLAGNAVLVGGAGNDRLTGNASSTVAVYSGARGDYDFALDGDGNLVVRDLRSGSPDGTDTLRAITSLQFADGTVPIAVVMPNLAPTAVTLSNLVSVTPENGAAVRVADVTVTDDGRGTNNLTLAGADAGLFELRTNATGGTELWFTGGADAEARTSYQVQVVVDDPAVGGTPDASAAFALTIGDVNESGVTAPVDVDDAAGGGIAENATGLVGITARAFDSDLTTNRVTYSLVATDGSAGANAGNFAIDPLTGEVRLVAAFDREALGTSGTVQVTVRATSEDGSTADTTFTVAVANVNEGVAFTSPTAVAVTENGLAAALVQATDLDGDAVSYSIVGGSDAERFVIDAVTGAVTFRDAPDFEAPADADGDNVYQLLVRASDGSLSDTQLLTVTVRNQNEGVTFTSGASFAVAENDASVGTISATDLDGDVVSYAIVGGADAALFTVDAQTGALSFRSAPDFETPTDNNRDNAYEVLVAASDGTLSVSRLLTVTVGNVNEAPAITSNGGANSATLIVSENSSEVATIVAEDAEGAVTYAIAGGADAARFTIDAVTGALRFVAAPNFEAPGDVNGDNRYEVVVRASDGSLSDLQSLVVSVQNVRDGLTLSGTSKGETLTGTAAEDTISGLAGHDTLYGNEGADILNGGEGNDRLFGGSGADTLTGGAGADTFTFTALADSDTVAIDQITDFNRAQNDKISVSGIDANALLSGDQAFTFIGSNLFSGMAGQLRSYVSDNRTFVAGDVNGDGVADFIINLGSASVQSSDFLL